MVKLTIDQNFRKVELVFKDMQSACEMADKILPQAEQRTTIIITCETEGADNGI